MMRRRTFIQTLLAGAASVGLTRPTRAAQPVQEVVPAAPEANPGEVLYFAGKDGVTVLRPNGSVEVLFNNLPEINWAKALEMMGYEHKGELDGKQVYSGEFYPPPMYKGVPLPYGRLDELRTGFRMG